eukprot:TRINITY_DN27579_c0_g1_i1.p1 TRINITY_DN27579_c0_g1~~TRINITY_DN27579_c0_g1_i1.p1  ORF type:complete len:663 (+),score=180.86 TRINITY_DN27579_c0_g1_i1:52-2040(+)
MISLKSLRPRAVLRIPRFSPNQSRTYHQPNLALDGPDRLAAFRDLTNRVFNKQECWAWQIQRMAFMISLEGNYGRTTPEEATNLMRACQRDIVDLFPSEQKILTEIAWDSVKSAQMTVPLTASFFNNMILAYTFQDLPIDDNALISQMNKARSPPNQGTYAYLLHHLCRNGEMEKALEYLEGRSEKNLPVTEVIVRSLILGHAGLGQISEGEKLLKLMNDKNIHWGKGCYFEFVLGCAKFGDVDGTEFFLKRCDYVTDQLLLTAVQVMHKNHPDRIGFLLDKMPRNVELFSSICRRTVKLLVEAGDLESAWKIVKKTRDNKENNSDKERVIKISPSVIVLRELISKSEDVNVIFKKMEELLEVDPKIVSRTVIILVDLCFEDKSKIKFARRMIEEIFLKSTEKEEADVRNYLGQNSKRRMFKAEKAKDKAEEEVLKVFEIFCSLGLKLDKIRAWDVMMRIMISNIPDEGTWTQATLLKRVHYVKDILSSHSNSNGGIYSHSVIWGTILQHLLNRENAIFFATAANLCVHIKVAFAPKRWHLSLANCLLKLKDVQSFVDIVDVSYKNSLNKRDDSDYCLVASSLSTAIKRGKKWRMDIDKPLGEVLDEIWRRGIKLPPDVRDDMIQRLTPDHTNLANALENIPVLGDETFKKSLTRNNIIHKR